MLEDLNSDLVWQVSPEVEVRSPRHRLLGDLRKGQLVCSGRRSKLGRKRYAGYIWASSAAFDDSYQSLGIEVGTLIQRGAGRCGGGREAIR